MEEPSTKMKMISWLFQIVAAMILAKAAYGKFLALESSVYVFNALDMGASSRILIGVIESISTILLLTSTLPHLGALLGFGVMLGAIIAHGSVLGLQVNNDNGMMVMMMSSVIVSTMIVMYIRRRRLPLIGHTCN